MKETYTLETGASLLVTDTFYLFLLKNRAIPYQQPFLAEDSKKFVMQ